MNLTGMFLLLLPMISGPDEPGVPDPDSSGTRLVVTADLDSATIRINGMPAGFTPATIDTLTPGRHAVSVRAPVSESWFAGALDDTVIIAAGETTRIRATLRRRLLLMSEPGGVPVYLGDSLAGFTPFLLSQPWIAQPQEVTLRPPASSPAGLLSADARRGVAHFLFTQERPPAYPGAVHLLHEEPGPPIRLYVAGGAALVSGIAAAAWKVRADEVYAEYRAGRDPAARDRTRRLDTASAVALAAMQISLGLFVYFVFSE